MNIAIVGYGKMGREIEKAAIGRGHKVALIVDVDNINDLNAKNIKNLGIEVAIEFSVPSAAPGNIERCFEAGVPVVSGTTGWLDRMPRIAELCREKGGALFYASNYSIGVNLMFRLNAMLARMMNRFDQYDVTIEETHHNEKKDSPSGTAITLAEAITGAVERKTSYVNNTTIEPGKLEITSTRRSNVAGTHTVTYESTVDELSLTHRAKSRTGFAQGAVVAAEFLRGRKGIYSMDDILEIPAEI